MVVIGHQGVSPWYARRQFFFCIIILNIISLVPFETECEVASSGR